MDSGTLEVPFAQPTRYIYIWWIFFQSYLSLGFELAKLKIDKLESEVLTSNLGQQMNKLFILKSKKGHLARGQLYKIPDTNKNNNPQISVNYIFR